MTGATRGFSKGGGIKNSPFLKMGERIKMKEVLSHEEVRQMINFINQKENTLTVGELRKKLEFIKD